jgi:hypothetical protein
VPCSFVEVDRRLGVYTAIIVAQMIEVVRKSETSADFNETIRRFFPEGCHRHARRCVNLQSDIVTNKISLN